LLSEKNIFANIEAIESLCYFFFGFFFLTILTCCFGSCFWY